jgi:hypothetical protein
MEMAKKVTVSFVDDLDGKTAADETVAFTLDGVAYEIDLSTKNAKKLRAALQPWIEAGRRVGGRRRRSIVGTSRITTEPRESAAIRVWARTHGYQVARRGRSQPTSWTPFGLLARQKHRSGGPLRHPATTDNPRARPKRPLELGDRNPGWRDVVACRRVRVACGNVV